MFYNLLLINSTKAFKAIFSRSKPNFNIEFNSYVFLKTRMNELYDKYFVIKQSLHFTFGQHLVKQGYVMAFGWVNMLNAT